MELVSQLFVSTLVRSEKLCNLFKLILSNSEVVLINFRLIVRHVLSGFLYFTSERLVERRKNLFS